MVEMILRRASPGDCAAIASLLNAFLDTTAIEWREEHWTALGIAEWLDEHETVLIAEDGDEIIGVAAFGWFRDVVKWPGYRFAVENTIHVREDHWGSGVGRELMSALINEAKHTGKHVMIAAVDGANHASIRFHERLGFTEVAHMSEIGEKFGQWQDLVLMQLRLDDRSTP